MSFSTHSRILFSSEYFHYKIFIHEKCLENLQANLSRPGIIDVMARQLRNTALRNLTAGSVRIYSLQWITHAVTDRWCEVQVSTAIS